jgi:hypothetical protein
MTGRLSPAHCRPRLDAASTPLLSSYAKRYNQKKMKEDGEPIEKIVRYTGLSEEKTSKL